MSRVIELLMVGNRIKQKINWRWLTTCASGVQEQSNGFCILGMLGDTPSSMRNTFLYASKLNTIGKPSLAQ